MKPASFNWRPYKNPPQVYQKSIANATKNLAHAAKRPWDYAAWYPSGAGHPGPAWDAMDEFEPTWVKPNTSRLWFDNVKKDAQGKPIGWDKEENYPAEWKSRYGRGGAPRRRCQW